MQILLILNLENWIAIRGTFLELNERIRMIIHELSRMIMNIQKHSRRFMKVEIKVHE
jgi:hypothetical protein